MADTPRHPTAAFEPFIPAEVALREFTLVPLLTGTVLGLVFGASSLYLVLKVGITVSASIPVAVIAVALFRTLSKFGFRPTTILENNIVQTAGSAGESIAFGIGVTMPAILILGFDLELTRVTLVAVLGGLLGILMMIPLRRSLIVENHATLKYPEGTACAAVLTAGASDESRAASRQASRPGSQLGARTIFVGFGVGLLYKTLMSAFRAWKEVPERVFGAPLKAGSVGAEISPELLGVGYIIGPRIASLMCGGGVLAYLVLIPAIKFFGEHLAAPLAPGQIPIREMGPGDIRGAYILYIGAGAVATGGIISLIHALPSIWHGIVAGLRDIRGPGTGASAGLRTDRDLPMKFVLAGCAGLVGLIMASPSLHMNVVGAVLIVALGFLFVTVSSRLVGEIGSSSNPISGMTIATLLLTCLVFLFLGWTGPEYYVTALSVGGIVCIAASNGGTTSQDLKTGFLIGATPRAQQCAILIGALASALLLGPVLLRLNDASTIYVPRITHEKLAGPPLTLDAARRTSLPPYPGAHPPPTPGPYQLLHLNARETGLDPGDYLVAPSGQVTYRVRENFPANLRVDPSSAPRKERIRGPQAAADLREFGVWHKTDSTNGPPGRYLVDSAGLAAYLVDPGINGTHDVRPDGSPVTKFDAPKATLVSYIIKGILNRELPWELVLLGAMISITLEMCGVSSLAFAVGVYLPLATSMPVFIGGLIRWAVDRRLRAHHARAGLSEEELVAETDKSPGVMLASGYIAGGALAGILIAFVAGVLVQASGRIEEWASASNPFYSGPWANALSLIPFALLVGLLWITGRRVVQR